jgi:glycosyltransferase involved in cell wall biosynthesis
LERTIVDHHRRAGFDFLYERYSLFSAAGVRAARALGIPCIVEVNAPLLLEQQAYRALECAEEAAAIECEVFAGADALVAVSDQMRRYAVSKGAAPERAFVVPNGVDISRFRPDVEPLPLDLPADTFVVGFVGSLKGWHDINGLLEAFRLLVGSADDCHLLIVGDGPLRGWIEGYTRGARLDGRVSITGWKSYESLPRLLTAVDVAGAPYRPQEEFYFSPLKLYEYLASGRRQDLAAKLRTLHDDSELRARLGQAAAAAARNHTWESKAQRILELLDLRGENGAGTVRQAR